MAKPKKKRRSLKGHFLIAAPSLMDPNFQRTVVLICDHGSHGAMGLILNRASRKQVQDLLPEATGPQGDYGRLHIGGPVGTDGLMVLHRLHRNVRGAEQVVPGVHLGGEQAFLKKVLGRKLKDDEAVRVFLGYAGWAADQLEHEMKVGGWIPCPAHASHVFDTAPERLWSEVLWSMGGVYRLISAMPADPELN